MYSNGADAMPWIRKLHQNRYSVRCGFKYNTKEESEIAIRDSSTDVKQTTARFWGTDGARRRICQKQLPIPPILPMGGSPGRAVCRCRMFGRARASIFRLKEFRASKRYSVIRIQCSSCPIIAMEQWQGSAGQTKVRQHTQAFANSWDEKVASFARPTALPVGISGFSCD